MNPELDLIFDGRCGFCTRSVGWVNRLDRHGRVRCHPAQRPGVLERFGLTPSQADESVWAVHAGTRVSGAHAIAVTLDIAAGVRIFERFYRLPAVRQVQERVYRWIADHRGTFPGVTPWCQAHPEDCARQGS